jgi:hypothetical protein
MKRCPQCEFIYEDDQSLCDMDGVLLVFDARTLPNTQALTTVTTKAAPKRNRAVPAFATVILALVLGMVYYVSTQRKTAETAYTPAATVEAAANPVAAESPAQVSAAQPDPQPAVEESKVEGTKTDGTNAAAATAVPAKKTSDKASTTSQIKPATAEKKDDSKVGSFFKKTGRILKKPFKL